MDPLASLDETVDIDPTALRSIRENGHALVRGLGRPEEIAICRPAIDAAVRKHAEKVPAIGERGTYGKAFIQVTNLWTRDEITKRFVFAPRFAKAAADLLGVPAVRLYHDQALHKEPGGGHTPWHQDQKYWPLDTDATITMWMPLVDVPADVGSMSFASGSHAHRELGPWIIGDRSESEFAAIVREKDFVVETYGAMRAGDATFHKGWTLHRAPPNPTGLLRSVMTVIWYADGTRIAAPSPTSKFDHQLWLDSRPIGSPADGPLNPRLWPREH